MAEIELTITFSFDPVTMLFSATLENGARFAFAPANVTGKLGANLALLRDYTLIEKSGSAPRPKGHDAARPRDFGAARDAALVEEAIMAGRLQRVGVIKAPKVGHVSLEDLGL